MRGRGPRKGDCGGHSLPPRSMSLLTWAEERLTVLETCPWPRPGSCGAFGAAGRRGAAVAEPRLLSLKPKRRVWPRRVYPPPGLPAAPARTATARPWPQLCVPPKKSQKPASELWLMGSGQWGSGSVLFSGTWLVWGCQLYREEPCDSRFPCRPAIRPKALAQEHADVCFVYVWGICTWVHSGITPDGVSEPYGMPGIQSAACKANTSLAFYDSGPCYLNFLFKN